MNDEVTRLNEEIVDAPGAFSRMISTHYIIREGEIPISGDSFLGLGGIAYSSYDADWQADDAYTRAIGEAVDRIAARTQENPILRELMEKDSWDRADRMLWEQEITGEMDQALSQICRGNLTRYRNDWLDEGVGRDSTLNGLSRDLENNTATIENDCDTMAITQAVILQRVEDRLLPERTRAMEAAGEYKCEGTYYVCYGRSARIGISDEEREAILEAAENAPPDQKELIEAMVEGLERPPKEGKYHAHIMSSETGCIVEATERRYIIPLNPDPIGDFQNGLPVLDSSGSAHFDSDDITINLADLTHLDHEAAQTRVAELQIQMRIRGAAAEFRADMEAVEERIASIEDRVQAAAEDPRLEMLGELFGTGRQQGLDEHSLEALQDMLEDSEVLEILRLIETDYDQAIKTLKKNIHNPFLRDNEDSITRLEQLTERLAELKPELLDSLPDRTGGIKIKYMSPEEDGTLTTLEDAESINEDTAAKIQDLSERIERQWKTPEERSAERRQEQNEIDSSQNLHTESALGAQPPCIPRQP